MRYIQVALAGSGLLLVAASVAFGAAGDPDLTFGTNGIATTMVGDVSEAYDLVQQLDGKLVTGGYVEEGFPRTTQFLLVRYHPDGTLDASFGTGGIVRTDAIPGQSTRAKSLVVQPDGKLLAVGFGALGSYWDAGGDVVLARYLTDGSLDAGFGSGGIVVTDVFGHPDQGTKTLLQPDGRIVVAGFTRTDAPTMTQDALIARYDGNGALDATFGIGGTVALDFGGRVERAQAVALQADGGIVIAGSSLDPSDPSYGPSSGILARVDADGNLDGAFGSGGSTALMLGLRTHISEMIELPDGDLLVNGVYSDDGIQGYSFLARFDANGALDLTFGGGDGVLEPSLGLFFGLGLDPNGAVLGVGPGFLWGHWNAFGVSRFDADGEPDSTFGYGGRASVFAGAGTYNAGGFAVVAEPDGSSITTAGFATDGPYVQGIGEPRYIALARFLATSPPCTGDGDCDACEHCSAGVCANGPRSACERPTGKGAQLLYASSSKVKPRIQWKWKAIAGSPGFDPQTQAVGLCMWWGDIAVYESSVPAGGGWKVTPNGTVTFRDKTRSGFGLEKIKVGRAGIDVKAQGENVRDNPNGFPDALLQPGDDSIPLHVQLNAESGKCYAATYPQASIPGTYAGHKRRGVGY